MVYLGEARQGRKEANVRWIKKQATALGSGAHSHWKPLGYLSASCPLPVIGWPLLPGMSPPWHHLCLPALCRDRMWVGPQTSSPAADACNRQMSGPWAWEGWLSVWSAAVQMSCILTFQSLSPWPDWGSSAVPSVVEGSSDASRRENTVRTRRVSQPKQRGDRQVAKVTEKSQDLYPCEWP